MPISAQDRSIADEMDALFAGVASTRGDRPAGVGAVPIAAAAPNTRRRGAGWMIAVAPVVLGLLGTGVYLRHADLVPPLRATRSAIPASHRHPSGAEAIAPDAMSSAPASSPVIAARESSIGPAPVIVGDAGSPPAVTRVDRPVPAMVRSAPASWLVPSPAAVADARADSAAATPASRCKPGDDGDDCIFQEVVAADHRLRAAYDGAAGAGAPPRALAAVTRRWEQARALADDDPDETIRRYRSLARELDDLRIQGR